VSLDEAKLINPTKDKTFMIIYRISD